MATEIRTIEADGTAILKDGSVWHREDAAEMSQHLSRVQLAAPALAAPNAEIVAVSAEARIGAMLGAALTAAISSIHPGMTLTKWLAKFFNGDLNALDRELRERKTAGVHFSQVSRKDATAGLIALENHWR